MCKSIKVSVVVRCRNEAKSLCEVLDALQAQRCSFAWEVVIVDNESADETREVCKRYNACVVSISRAEFTYGRALNLGISHARGELILLLSAHSLPVGSNFLESAVAPFEDPLMAAARCLRSTDTAKMVHWFRPSVIQYQSLEEQKAAESGVQWTRNYPAANGCVIRRSVWEQVRYDEQLESNEDKLWASEVLKKGFKIQCCAEAVFVYTRMRGKVAAWRRQALDYKALYRISGYVPLRWPQFLFRVARALLLAPLVAVRYVVENVVGDVYLVTVPWQAKFVSRGGSLSEFNKRK